MRCALGVAPSILSADFSCLRDEVHEVESQSEMVHVDVMDGHFVPNITIGPPVVAALRKVTSIPLDCHLMVSEPGSYVDAFAAAGADIITVHAEAARHLQGILARIHRLGKRAGVALCPHTSVEVLRYVLADLDLVLVMCVNPGFGAQTFLPAMLQKIADVRLAIDGCGRPIRLEVDGGINQKNAGSVVRAGADLLVAGSAIYGSPDRRGAIAEIRDAAMRGSLT
jgi:ribulose-phosphate 3-epimerase